jgi:hypothetical protein
VSQELIVCFFCKQEYPANVIWKDGILYPDMEHQLECLNLECESNLGEGHVLTHQRRDALRIDDPQLGRATCYVIYELKP